MIEGIELPNLEKSERSEKKRNLQILENIESRHHQTCGDERKNFKKTSQENEKMTRNQTTEQKSHQRDKHWDVPFVRNLGTFLKWTKEELQQLGQRTMHKALHPIADIHRLYVSRKEGGRGLASIDDSVDASI